MTDNMEMDVDTGVDILTLVDEDGVEHEFEVADTLENEDKNYIALIPILADEEDDEGELVVLRVITDEETGEEFLEPIEDEEEFEAIGDLFMERLKEEFDFAE